MGNLGSVNLARHLKEDTRTGAYGLALGQLRDTMIMAMCMLDNVIEYNCVSMKTARDANLRYRPVGLGVMGSREVLYSLRVTYD